MREFLRGLENEPIHILMQGKLTGMLLNTVRKYHKEFDVAVQHEVRDLECHKASCFDNFRES